MTPSSSPTTIVYALLLAVFMATPACFFTSTPEETVLKEAFSAIKNEDWEAYRKITTTTADIEIKRQNLSPMKAKKGYLGGVLRPSQIEQLKMEFEEAVAGEDPDCDIDFSTAEFRGVGTLLEQGTGELMLNGTYDYFIYSLSVEIDDEVIDTQEMSPKFLIVPWGKEFRVMALIFD